MPPPQRPSPAATFLRELIARQPSAPALRLAKVAYARHPELWPNLNACRLAVGRILGVQGNKNRRQLRDRSLVRAPRPAGWSDVIPEAVVQLPDWRAVEIPGPHRVLVLSDLHIPYHDAEALEVALEYGFKRKPTLILLNGDVCDHFAMSFWETDPRERDFPREVKAAKHFLAGLRKRAGRGCRIVLKLGNHEERYQRYMTSNAPELLGLDEFQWENVFRLAEYGIEFVGDKRVVKLNELNVLHGHEYKFQISNPVNPARGLFLRAKTNAACAHFHQSSNHSAKNLDGKVVSTWSTGCLCDLHPRWLPHNDWNHGFASIELGKGTGFHVENNRIVGGKVW
jgi:predicted phosphodiesterase